MAVANDLSQVRIMDKSEGQQSYCSDLRGKQELEVEKQQVESGLENLDEEGREREEREVQCVCACLAKAMFII